MHNASLTRRIIELLQQRGYQVEVEEDGVCEQCLSNREIKWYLFIAYLIWHYSTEEVKSSFGLWWILCYLGTAEWRGGGARDGFLLGFFVWAVSVAVWGTPVPEMKFYIVIYLLALADCFFFCCIVVLLLALILILLALVGCCTIFSDIYGRINRSYRAKKRQRLLKELAMNESLNTESKECAICLEAAGKICVLECEHAFHKDCILQWLKESRTCPICRRDLY